MIASRVTALGHDRGNDVSARATTAVTDSRVRLDPAGEDVPHAPRDLAAPRPQGKRCSWPMVIDEASEQNRTRILTCAEPEIRGPSSRWEWNAECPTKAAAVGGEGHRASPPVHGPVLCECHRRRSAAWLASWPARMRKAGKSTSSLLELHAGHAGESVRHRDVRGGAPSRVGRPSPIGNSWSLSSIDLIEGHESGRHGPRWAHGDTGPGVAARRRLFRCRRKERWLAAV
jgi:hypothetical protein